MKEINPLKFSRNLFDTYRRYLFSFVPIGDSELRDLFWRALGNSNYEIFKGPYVHCPPQYKKSVSPHHLMHNDRPPFLDKRLLKCDKEFFNPERPLYTHQIEALEKLQKGGNIIISTGTGSGKTEGFLIPLLHDALQHPAVGVRAVIIYPMNALANDQLERLRDILKSVPEITFGRYTGETPQDDNDARERGYDVGTLAPNEKLTREKIREKPPHILLTNFAMLEYLLLRPSDADIFSHKSVQYVVLDEAHTYTGAQGIDISMLLRRFKSLFTKNKLQFILTSATISEYRSDAAKFATNLCGVPFEENDVILGEEVLISTQPKGGELDLSHLASTIKTEEDLQQWCDALHDEDRLFDLLNASAVFREKIGRADADKMLFDALNKSSLVDILNNIRELCRKEPITVDKLALRIFNSASDDSRRIMTWLLLIGSHAREDKTSPPLLPIKLHYFLRGLLGVRVCVNRECKGEGRVLSQLKWKALFLEERETCKYCKSKVLSLSACVHCGLPVFKVYVKEDKWQTIKPGENNPETHLLTFKFNAEDSEAVDILSYGNRLDRLVRRLCLRCGSFQEGAGLLNCCDEPQIEELVELNSKDNGNVSICPQCNGRAGRFNTVFREFMTGDDAPTSVIAEGILRELPGVNREKPAEGRSLIAFSDSRQRAAFFAPYLSRTTLETAFQQVLITAIEKATTQNEGHLASIDEIAGQYVAIASQSPFLVTRRSDSETGDIYKVVSRRELTQSIKNKLRKDVTIELFRQICRSPRHRNSLSGLTLAYVYVEFNEYEEDNIIKHIPELFGPKIEGNGLSVMQVLSQIFLKRMAVDFPDWISMDMIVEGRRRSSRFHRSNSDTQLDNRIVYRWNPYAALERRQGAISASVPLKILKKLFPESNHGDRFYDELLGKIWDMLTASVLIDRDRGEYQLNNERILIGTKTDWYKCNTCGTITAYSLLDKCPLPDCEGKLTLLDNSRLVQLFVNDHNFERIVKRDVMPIEVKEHTAQLTNEAGRKYQEEFRQHDINVLSTSTTFELGIDIGQLKSVFLRNMPPTTNSYVQRSGRAGRRLDGTSFVVTFSRNVPHDQYFFNDPIRIANGRITAPIINMRNDKLVQRHINSYLIGRFLSTHCKSIPNRQLTLEWFFLLPNNTDSPSTKFISWIRDNGQKLLKEVRPILPAESPLINSDSVAASAEMIDNSKLKYIDNELERYAVHLAELNRVLQTATGNTRTGIAKAMERIENIVRQFKSQALIDFLSSISWLPSYAFPQDIVKLRVMQEKYSDKMRLERDREYGIAEYAPGAEIIADGKRFRSRGLVFYGREPEIKKYRFCRDCRRLYIRDEFTREDNCESCRKRLSGRDGGDYIEPLGFTTSITDPIMEPDLTRQLPPPNTDVFLLEGSPEEIFQSHPVIKGISYGFHQRGRLFKANRGYSSSGFRICQKCGIDLNSEQRGEHKTPWGSKCTGQVRRIHLAHQFLTEILQLRFSSAPERWSTVFWLSLSEAFRNGVTKTLEIERRDIGVTFRGIAETSSRGEIVLYDRVPGSAGYLQAAIEKLPEILVNILTLLKNCPCDIESSCYICLRSYDNQFYWEHLKRKPIVEWLERFIL